MTDEARQQLVADIRAKRGYIYAWQEALAESDYEFISKYEAMWDTIGARSVHVPQKYKQMILVAVLVSRLDDTSMRTQIRRALALGATKEELFEAIEVAFLASGAPALVHGIRAVLDVVAEAAPPERAG